MALALAAALPLLAATAGARAQAPTPCRLDGLEHAALCGQVQRPLDPARPLGPQIQVHYALLPALARNPQPDPVVFFAGGPGQSAIELAGPIHAMLARLSNRRDILLIDQRGTGLSAPLACPAGRPTAPLSEQLDPARVPARMQACRSALQKLPWGDLRFYATWIASQDTEAVRRAIGAARLNLVGGSYGTRAALDYLRQYPQHVRRVVLDGVAPPGMVLPASFSTDNQAALDGLLAACEGDADCHRAYPTLRADWRALLASLPLEASVAQPLTGQVQRLTFTRDMVLGLVRGPLYAPWLAAGLPLALHEAAQGRFEPLVGLSAATEGGPGKLYEGMHFSVVCSEDAPRLDQAGDLPGADFGQAFAQQYRQVCADWPRGPVPADFYRLPVARVPALLLAGGADPATPPRHAAEVARALGPMARQVTVAQAGHGLLAIPCLRDLVYRFIDAASDARALRLDAGCAARLPRPPAFVPVHDGDRP
ncbi:MAG: alpha/beta fold hydrolase [Burkholderiales bacterium]|nr:alpha/beta fold hydrolase [Burkholderiales bacterium]